MNAIKLFGSLLLVVAMTGCKESYVTYSDVEYVMFADTLTTNMVVESGEPFKVAVSSTVACDYDRTFGVEVIDKGSNAIEGRHYRLASNSVTIPAGERAAHVDVYGNYANIEPTDSLGFTLQLVMPEQLKWPLYEQYNRTKVVMYKSCPFDLENFTGWCVLTSLFLYSYPGENVSYQRLVKTVRHPSEPNTIILESMFYDGYDVTMKFNPENPAQPTITMDKGQVVSDEASVFGQILGDNHILCDDSSYALSYFNACQRYAELWVHIYVEDLGVPVGTVGNFYNILEWITQEEYERLRREGL